MARLKGVYPRVHGGTVEQRPDHHHGHGLSPRARGNRMVPSSVDQQMGSIPACTGEPGAARPHRPAQGVYPRVHGGTRRGRAR